MYKQNNEFTVFCHADFVQINEYDDDKILVS